MAVAAVTSGAAVPPPADTTALEVVSNLALDTLNSASAAPAAPSLITRTVTWLKEVLTHLLTCLGFKATSTTPVLTPAEPTPAPAAPSVLAAQLTAVTDAPTAMEKLIALKAAVSADEATGEDKAALLAAAFDALPEGVRWLLAGKHYELYHTDADWVEGNGEVNFRAHPAVNTVQAALVALPAFSARETVAMTAKNVGEVSTKEVCKHVAHLQRCVISAEDWMTALDGTTRAALNDLLTGVLAKHIPDAADRARLFPGVSFEAGTAEDVCDAAHQAAVDKVIGDLRTPRFIRV